MPLRPTACTGRCTTVGSGGGEWLNATGPREQGILAEMLIGLAADHGEEKAVMMCPSGECDPLMSSGLFRVTPRHEFIEAVDFVVCNVLQNPAQPSLRVDAIEFGGLDQGEGDGHCFAAAL